MKRNLTFVIISLLVSVCSYAQDFGLSFSYFIPKNGEFSTPISPFSIRGVGFDINRFLAIETGATLYRMSGLNIKDIPLESNKPLLGSNFTIFVPAELVIGLRGSKVQFDIKGGGFFFYGLGQKLNYGNIDRAIKQFEQWQVANADLSFENNPGFGYHAGAELTVYVTSQVGVSIETNYLMGEAKFPLTGTYTGGNSSLETRTVDFNEAKIDFTGLEFSLGLIFSSGGGGRPKPKSRRR
jgi:hypothetical protein